MKTSLALISALQTGALAWIEQREPPSVEALDLPVNAMGDMIRQAYCEQSSLGWNVLFRGFWSNSWRLAQEEQFRMNFSCEAQDTGERWAARAQSWFFDTFLILWKMRNEDEHGADSESQREGRLSKCARSIHRLYDAGKHLSYADRHPFRDSIEDVLQQPVQLQDLWILQTEAYLRKVHQRQRDRSGQPAITNFFARLHG